MSTKNARPTEKFEESKSKLQRKIKRQSTTQKTRERKKQRIQQRTKLKEHSHRSINENMLRDISTGEAKRKISNLIRGKSPQEKHDTWLDFIPECPTYKPTMRQFSNFGKYIKTLEHNLKTFGIVKVRAPVE